MSKNFMISQIFLHTIDLVAANTLFAQIQNFLSLWVKMLKLKRSKSLLRLKGKQCIVYFLVILTVFHLTLIIK